MGTDHEVWFAVLVHHFGACLQPDPTRVLGEQTVRDQPRAARLDHCNTPSVCEVHSLRHTGRQGDI